MLVVRAVISAIGIIVAQLNNFAHPYNPRILSVPLILEGMSSEYPELTMLREEVDCCLCCALKIPTRPSVPLLLQSAAAFADLMAEVAAIGPLRPAVHACVVVAFYYC